MIIPAALASGGTISGKVATPSNMTLTTDVNRTVNASILTVYAQEVGSTFVNTTNPGADGRYSIYLADNGMYRIWVAPDEVLDAGNYSYQNLTGLALVQYPQSAGSRTYLINVNGDKSNVDINYYTPGSYVPPNDLMLNGTPTATPTATPKSPGFAAAFALAGLLGAFALVSRRR